MLRFVRAVVVAIATSSLTALLPSVASAQFQQGQPMILPVDQAPLVVETQNGPRSFTIEIADTDQNRSAGLMFRTDMPDDRGMLFVFPRTHRTSFWMMNTPMALDLAFINESGHIVAIRWGQPFSAASIQPLTPSRFVLELKAGTAQKAGIREGDRVRHPRIDEIAGAE
jgi:uncharacterized membrane protein (UPF0127 family)